MHGKCNARPETPTNSWPITTRRPASCGERGLGPGRCSLPAACTGRRHGAFRFENGGGWWRLVSRPAAPRPYRRWSPFSHRPAAPSTPAGPGCAASTAFPGQHFLPSLLDHIVGHIECQHPVLHRNCDRIAILNQPDQPAVGGLGGHMADRQPGRAPREPAVGDKCALFAQASALQERCGVQHFLHSRPPGRPS